MRAIHHARECMAESAPHTPWHAVVTRQISLFRSQQYCVAKAEAKAMDERETECLVELLTQSLFDPRVYGLGHRRVRR